MDFSILRLVSGRRCNICGWSGWRFKTMRAPRYKRRDAVCPGCGSHERHRALIAYISANEALEGKKVLDVAPVRSFRGFFSGRGARYVSTDLFAPAMVKGTLLASPFKTGVFDIILCYHVLEHIKDDVSAMRELGRMCSRHGSIYIQVPMGEGLERTVEFDAPDPYCHDHVRDYGADVEDRIRTAGLEFERHDFSDAVPPSSRILYGAYKAVGTTYVCRPSGG